MQTQTIPTSESERWADWRWQLKNRIRSVEELEARIRLTAEERRAATYPGAFGWGITPHYLSLADPADPTCPIRRQCVPHTDEYQVGPAELGDPLGEVPLTPVAGLIHRYPDRALLLTTDRCAMYCRYCTRKRLVSSTERQLSASELEQVTSYLLEHTEIREVILSGGDPLVSGDRYLEQVLTALHEVPHIELLRIHTRMPVVNPFRITESLAALLRRFQPLFVVTHFNHPYELTDEAGAAIARLVDAGVPVANQAVLLRGINSDATIIEALCRQLAKNRIWSYYLHQGDLAEGTETFRTPISKGLEIIETLRGRLSGYAIPQLIVDLPGGRGKISLTPDRILAHHDRTWHFRGPLGEAQYTDPAPTDCSCPTTVAVAKAYL